MKPQVYFQTIKKAFSKFYFRTYKKYYLLLVLILATSALFQDAEAMNRLSRLGLGYSGQLKTGQEALSFKIQKSKGMAFGGILGYSSGDNGGFGAGVKVYKILIDEPKLEFFASGMAALLSKKIGAESESGFQVDLTLGSEFSFDSIESLGFSVEFGLSINKVTEFQFQTTGSNFIIGAVHFYL